MGHITQANFLLLAFMGLTIAVGITDNTKRYSQDKDNRAIKLRKLGDAGETLGHPSEEKHGGQYDHAVTSAACWLGPLRVSRPDAYRHLACPGGHRAAVADSREQPAPSDGVTRRCVGPVLTAVDSPPPPQDAPVTTVRRRRVKTTPLPLEWPPTVIAWEELHQWPGGHGYGIRPADSSRLHMLTAWMLWFPITCEGRHR